MFAAAWGAYSLRFGGYIKGDCNIWEDSPNWRIMEQASSAPEPNRVREHRERLGMTRAELALLSGLSVGAIGHIETGYRALTDRTLTILSNALGVRKGMLLCEVGVFGSDPRHSDIAETEIERLILRFWRKLPPERQDLAISMFSKWADETVRPRAVG